MSSYVRWLAGDYSHIDTNYEEEDEEETRKVAGMCMGSGEGGLVLGAREGVGEAADRDSGGGGAKGGQGERACIYIFGYGYGYGYEDTAEE